MEGVDRLIEKILEDARQQAKQNLERAQKEAETIANSAADEAQQKRMEIIEKAKGDTVEIRKRMLANAHLEARKRKLQVKQEIVRVAFDKAIEALNSLPIEQYRNILVNMAVCSISKGDAEIILSARDKNRLGHGFIDTVNNRLREMGLKSSVKLSDETRDILGGFILKSSNMEINNTFEAIIKMRREQLEAEVVKTLFRE